MKCTKIMTFALIAVMIAAGGASFIGFHDSDADSDSAQTIKVFYNATGTETWTSSGQNAYNVYLAIYGAMSSLGYTFETTASNTQWYVTSGGYSNPNMTYGQIDKVNGLTDFTILGYNSTSGWVDISGVALGWLRPYSDYADVSVVGSTHSVYANIAIKMGNASTGSISSGDLIGLTSVQNDPAYYYTFFLIDSSATVAVPSGTQVKTSSGVHSLTDEDLQSGITVCGYGSDAYLALKDAVGSALDGQLTSWIDHGEYYTYYSWMDTLFGVGTTSETSEGITTYHYWASYDDSMESYLDWTLGYYSTVHFDADNVQGNFAIMYV